MTSQILKSVDSSQTQKSRYLNETIFFCQIIRIYSLYIKAYDMVKKFSGEGNLFCPPPLPTTSKRSKLIANISNLK